jgi:hypothetical protein
LSHALVLLTVLMRERKRGKYWRAILERGDSLFHVKESSQEKLERKHFHIQVLSETWLDKLAKEHRNIFNEKNIHKCIHSG